MNGGPAVPPAGVVASRRRRIRWTAGIVLCLLFVVADVGQTVHEGARGVNLAVGALLLVGLALLIVGCLVEAVPPSAVLVAVVAIVATVTAASSHWGGLPMVLLAGAVYRFAAPSAPRRAVPAALAVWLTLAVAAVIGVFAGGEGHGLSFAHLGAIASDFVLLTAVTSVAMVIRSHRALLGSLEERAVQAEREQQWLADRAVEAERVRIARDLHDVVAHHVSLLVVQAGAVRETLPSDHPTRAVLDSMIGGGRQAMTELRDMLDALRLNEDPAPSQTAVGSPGGPPDPAPGASPAGAGEGGAGAQAGAGPAPRSPQPGLGDLHGLVRRARSAGVGVVLGVDGTLADVPEVVGLAVYRIAQEALTNVVKHAPGAPCTVRVAVADRWVDLWVVNDAPARPEGAGTAAAVVPAAPAGGHGLMGMRERAALAHGEVVAGPLGDGFTVHARLPIPPGRPAPAAVLARSGR